MPRQVEFFRWFYVDPVKNDKKERRTSYKMDAETARTRFPGCRPDQQSREVRIIYRRDEEPPSSS